MSETARPLSIAIVGCGEVTEHKHLPVLRMLADVRVVALIDSEPARARSLASRFGVPHAGSDLAYVLGRSDIDAVAVGVPPAAHVEVAIAAIDAGKHVLVEKPVSLTLDNADRLVARAAASPRKVMVGFHMRFHRLVRQAKAIVESGVLGPLESVRSIWNVPRADRETALWKHRRETGGGSILELGVHHFDLWSFLLGTHVASIFAESTPGQRDDEVAVATARLENGVLASVVLSERTSHNIEFEVSGRAGRVRVACLKFDGLEVVPTSGVPGSFATRLERMRHTWTELPGGVAAGRQGGDYLLSYRNEWRHFVDAIRDGRAIESTAEDGREALAVALAALASASSGLAVAPAQAPRAPVPSTVASKRTAVTT